MQLTTIAHNFQKEVRTLVRCTEKFLENGLQVQLVGSVLVAMQYQQAVQSRLGHRSSQYYVFSRRKAEKLRSAVADVAGTSSNLVKRQT